MADFVATPDNKSHELKRAFQLLTLLKEKGVRLSHFGVSYKNKTMQLQPDEIHLIFDFGGVERWLVDYK